MSEWRSRQIWPVGARVRLWWWEWGLYASAGTGGETVEQPTWGKAEKVSSGFEEHDAGEDVDVDVVAAAVGGAASACFRKGTSSAVHAVREVGGL